ncbi:DDE superfamily endonuclease [Popillia japonica]|uniref:DDE superfamily endonuclease n=1 Tax=Popillia japonica TaxID=7064 RepID=A0AAW1LUL4_POPJA
MPRNYKKKTNRREWSQDNLIAAIHAIENEGYSCNNAAVTFAIPEATLRRYIGKRKANLELPTHGRRYLATFNAEQQHQLVDYMNDLNHRAFGLTSAECRKLAFEFAEVNQIPHRFNTQTKMAGKDWLYAFMKTHRISLPTPESTSIARLAGFNKVSVRFIFDLLKDVKLKHNFSPDRIYNADESGLSTVTCKTPKVLSHTGERRIAKIASAERGRNTTVVCAMNSQGTVIPPFLIFARVRMRPELLFKCPPNTYAVAQPSGWMTKDCFTQYLHHFARYAHPSKENPVLLVVDNHTSHISFCPICSSI